MGDQETLHSVHFLLNRSQEFLRLAGRTFGIALFVFCLFSVSANAQGRGPEGTVVVGIFQFEPFNYIDGNGDATGLNPDLLREMVKEESWKVKFVPGSWAKCLERLQSGEIDLMMSVAYSPARSQVMDYTYESVAELWGQAFILPGSKIRNITDLSGRRVAIMKKDISAANFKKTAEGLGILCEYVELPSHHDVFRAVRDGEVAAGIAPQHFGLRHIDKYNLVGSTIMFSPFSIYFTTKKGSNHELLSHIDAHLRQWKNDPNSFYYKRLNDWLGWKVPKPFVPAWLFIVLGAVTLAACLFTVFTVVLKRTVERKSLELQKSEERYKRFVNVANEGIIATDHKDRMIFVNPKMADMLGYRVDDLLHKDMKYILFAEDFTDHKEKVGNRANGVDERYERRLKCQDGTQKWAIVSATGIWDENSVYTGSFGMFTDITDRKIAENKLREVHDRFLAIFDGIDATIYVADLTTHEILFMNRRMIELFGGDMTGQTCWQALRKSSGPCDNCKRVKLVDEHGHPTGVQIREDRHPVTQKYNLYSERAIRWVDGRLVRIQFATDITKIKELEEKERQYEQNLQQAQKLEAVGTLAGGIAHDFNNILSSVIGYTEIALDDELEDNSPARESLENVIKAGLRARDLVKRLLVFSRQSHYELEAVPVAEILSEVMEMVRATLPANIRVEQQVDVINDKVWGGSSQIHQIVINLCNNASYAMAGTNGVLSVSLDNIEMREDDPRRVDGMITGPYLELKVADTGFGMRPEIAEKIFDPFFTTKPKEEGTGLGLSVSHGIIKELGGNVTVESEPGKGSVFSVYLPVISGVDVTGKNKSPAVRAMGSERILVVDDEVQVVTVHRKMLQRLGYSVYSVSSSKDALELFQKDPLMFDLVITDQAMPDMTGDVLAAKMLSLRPELPVILCTGYSNVIDEKSAKKIGIREFLLKPVGSEMLASAVRRSLSSG